MPVSSHAAINGSQWPEWSVGNPSMWGASENVMALKPRARVAPHLGRAHLGIEQVRDLQGDHAAGADVAQSSMTQSFHARTHASASAGSSVSCCRR